MTDVLADLVACETLRGSFPRGVPRRGCLRRQLELRREGKGWSPAHPTCAACPWGRVVRGEVERAGVALGTCPKCGAATIGADTCDACDEVRSLREVRAREIERPSPSSRIWAGEVPDTAIAPPPRADVGLSAEAVASAAARVREAMTRPTVVAVRPPQTRSENQQRPAPPAPANPEPPAEPAEEEHMPKGYARGAACRTCGATGPRHKKNCAEDGEKQPSSSTAAPKPPPPVPGAARRPKLVVQRVTPRGRPVDAEALMRRREQLVAELDRVDAQLLDALDAEERRLERLRQACAAAAERAARVQSEARASEAA